MIIVVKNMIWSATAIYPMTELCTRNPKGNYGHFSDYGHFSGDRFIFNYFNEVDMVALLPPTGGNTSYRDRIPRGVAK
jgi:hypothetical protein